jgi:glutamate dehydrogenase (NADP+)
MLSFQIAQGTIILLISTATSYDRAIQEFMEEVYQRNPHEPEFHQAVEEVASDIIPFVAENPSYQDDELLRRLVEPDRVVMFRVSWEDDAGEVHVNRGMRVQFNNAIGPYKGGLRFTPDLTLSVLKFLGFEQIFKNSLTGLPIGGGKGGADFDPKGRSPREIMRFRQAFMTELVRHIGPDTDAPAGDQGVGTREVNYLFGQYRRIRNEFSGVITGKGMAIGGSELRPEATGYGVVYFASNMLEQHGDGLKDKVCVISGSGNVSIYTAEKAIAEGARVVTLSDSDGFIYDKNGIDQEKLEWVKELKFERRGRIREYAEKFGAEFYNEQTPWRVPCDVAFPCATQREVLGQDAEELIENGVKAVAEGANMPCTAEATHLFREKVLYGPGKAANAGGVAVSGLEQSQNSIRLSWTREEVDAQLHKIVNTIHSKCVEHGQNGGHIDYMKGANIAGFLRVADAMLASGVM